MDFSKMDGYEFERYISTMLRNMGFVVEETTYSNDGGIDVIAIWEKPIFSGKYIIQCKNWQGLVGAPEVRDLYGVVMDQRANKGILISTSDFTMQAYAFAEGKNIELLNGSTLQKLITENGVKTNEKETRKIPSGFNQDRFLYLKKRIETEPRESKYYDEMISFLREYIVDEEEQGVSEEILNLIVKYTDAYMQKCLNVKSKRVYKKAEELNLAAYLILLGRLDEALEIVMDNNFFRRFEIDEEGSGIQMVSTLYGNDFITQNLYMAFVEMGYVNGKKVIEELPMQSARGRVRRQRDIARLLEYKHWDKLHEIYSSVYYVSNSFKIEEINNKMFVNREELLCIPASWIYGRITDKSKIDLCEKLDKVFKQHGIL